MSEGDVVLMRPATENLLFGDEAVVAPLLVVLVLYVRHALVRTPRVVVVIRQLLGSCPVPAKKVASRNPLFFENSAPKACFT